MERNGLFKVRKYAKERNKRELKERKKERKKERWVQ